MVFEAISDFLNNIFGEEESTYRKPPYPTPEGLLPLGPVSAHKVGNNPLHAEFAANAIPGRYDNLPRLEAPSKTTASQLLPHHWDDFDYQGQNECKSIFERQCHVLTPQETPLSYGILPNVKRGTGTKLPDPLPGHLFKPQKRELTDSEMFMVDGDFRAAIDPRMHQGVVEEVGRRAREESKLNSGVGALNDWQLGDNPGSIAGPLRGFSTGEIKSEHTGGYHPRERIWRVDETRKGRNCHVLRPNPAAAGAFALGPQTVGEVRQNRNADVREWGRDPMPCGGARKAPGIMNMFVDMRNSQRDPGFLGQDGYLSTTTAITTGDIGMCTRQSGGSCSRRQKGFAGRGVKEEQKGPVYNPDEL